MTHSDRAGVPTAYTRARARKTGNGNDASACVIRHRGVDGGSCQKLCDRLSLSKLPNEFGKKGA